MKGRLMTWPLSSSISFRRYARSFRSVLVDFVLYALSLSALVSEITMSKFIPSTSVERSWHLHEQELAWDTVWFFNTSWAFADVPANNPKVFLTSSAFFPLIIRDPLWLYQRIVISSLFKSFAPPPGVVHLPFVLRISSRNSCRDSKSPCHLNLPLSVTHSPDRTSNHKEDSFWMS